MVIRVKKNTHQSYCLKLSTFNFQFSIFFRIFALRNFRRMQNNRIKHFVGAFLTVLMVSYFACLSLCLHTHVVDSKVVTHAHPYKSSSHTHSGAEIILLKQFASFKALIPTENVSTEPYFAQISEVNTFISLIFEPHYLTLTSLRAPPFSL